ncbi:MAG: hypothetical protein GXC76_00360 [Rhodanobacteraceae bacterium]|jgi:hypothetical protein|nr:hypothetical protein [Rhodanobacteraceae bacterium]
MSPAIEIREAVDGADIARALFRRRFGGDPPDFPHHVLAVHRTAAGGEVPLCYVHFTALGELLLGGGACVDNRAMRALPPAARAAIHAGGGLYRMTLAWAVRHFAPRYAAVFGYCGDALAERIDLAVGFERTAHQHLLVYWTRELPSGARDALIAQAHAVGPF